MSVSSHVEELRKKHQHLSTQVEEAQRAPGISDSEIASMKKQKLRLKEQIARLSMSVS
ncbi:YdcH family protein [Rhodalgimonas zhirmunskyi]|uniref:YdcH family protein n=1 Tax=Rhodalgimonas zhirmunskyi TaxID=2964767 RepID=A0AAJ1U8T4_9RHOB|nr:YdcH family protein [Rhodoalgimonas zhirmunskyi]MDQ2093238.1 YdcH family protein [Rhodoalgimonas zhirmunskyi]